jgi:hypothetical protein
MLESAEALITLYRCRWENPLNAAAAADVSRRTGSSGAAVPDRSD